MVNRQHCPVPLSPVGVAYLMEVVEMGVVGVGVVSPVEVGVVSPVEVGVALGVGVGVAVDLAVDGVVRTAHLSCWNSLVNSVIHSWD